MLLRLFAAIAGADQRRHKDDQHWNCRRTRAHVRDESRQTNPVPVQSRWWWLELVTWNWRSAHSVWVDCPNAHAETQ
jgi:hypothetical protein